LLAANPTTLTTTAKALRRLIRTAGGVTFDHGTGHRIPEGIAVCAEPQTAWHFPFSAWDDTKVTAWLDRQRRRLAVGDVNIGGWFEPSTATVWLELVWVLPERLKPAAIAIGRLHDQHAVFDLRRGQLLVLDLVPDADVG
jgi:hypothetical protein